MSNETWDSKGKILPIDNKGTAKVVPEELTVVKTQIDDNRAIAIENPEIAMKVDYGEDWDDVISIASPTSTDRVYQLSARVLIKKIPLNNKGVVYYQNRVYFIPEQSTELIYFYNTYLPENLVEDENNLIERMFMCLPLGRPFIGYMTKGDMFVQERHIVLMNNEMWEKFKPYNNQVIRIDCLTQKEYEDMYNNG